jgi:hypothetical protein
MRFHKSKRISAADAEALIDSPTSSLNGNSVISHNNDWYDVRLMTMRELDDFVSDLLHAERAALESGLITPH